MLKLSHLPHPVANEWIGYPKVRLATLALYCGLIVGAIFWGTTCDVWGCAKLISYPPLEQGVITMIFIISPCHPIPPRSLAGTPRPSGAHEYIPIGHPQPRSCDLPVDSYSNAPSCDSPLSILTPQTELQTTDRMEPYTRHRRYIRYRSGCCAQLCHLRNDDCAHWCVPAFAILVGLFLVNSVLDLFRSFVRRISSSSTAVIYDPAVTSSPSRRSCIVLSSSSPSPLSRVDLSNPIMITHPVHALPRVRCRRKSSGGRRAVPRVPTRIAPIPPHAPQSLVGRWAGRR